jgi:hypothetical protein
MSWSRRYLTEKQPKDREPQQRGPEQQTALDHDHDHDHVPVEEELILGGGPVLFYPSISILLDVAC